MHKAIRLLIVDDHTVARHGVRLMLSGADDIEVGGEAESGAEALQLLQRQRFDVALLDVGLPDRNGLDLLKVVREQQPALAVLMVSMYAEDIYAVRALKHGAAGYLTKNCSPATLVAAVRKAAAGGKYVSPALLQKLAGMLGQPAAGTHDRLSDRELDIFKMIAAGDSLVLIAAALHLSPSTVTTYRARILDKMAMKSNAELTRYAVEHGLLC
ncbi:response regulator transcription factor [Janthinobacterium fluminis]|uniref:Response regulator transcription factor n=1 Tax=Janthinobacterium fluminis TaxID=2987524 RepID=A0ABT5JV50_9BURK|nr:response regulator transcription factor [Janthinobacterium fluminis]MDC8756449.1 response regulator transcription factor [Janthinobacterium fluminis]